MSILAEELREKFAKNLKFFREKAGLTQVELADRLDISPRYVQQLEGKKAPNIRLDTLDHIAEALEIPVTKLIENKPKYAQQGNSNVQPNQTLREIEMCTGLLSLSINRALNVGTTLLFIQQVFYQWPGSKEEMFKTNPANIDLYSSLNASVEYAIVEAFAHIQYAEKLMPNGQLPFKIHGRSALRAHRDIISHPANISWSFKTTKRFFEKDLHYKDPKPLRLWGILSSWIEGAEKLGCKTKEYEKPSIQVTASLAEAAWTILRYSFKNPQGLLAEDIFKKMKEAFPSWEKETDRLYWQEVATGKLYGEQRADSDRKKTRRNRR